MCLLYMSDMPVTTKRNLSVAMNDAASARLQVNKWAFLICILKNTITSAMFRIQKGFGDFAWGE